ncbi:VOC family protein [Sphingomonas metalli]|uniref:VOC family protein n=1 Tax=Sphingomonas metalli TaxID=1779358 RepID=A0A916T1D4_9SPHN|nr:VOC family protein [Sphingomonas metalli]GGB27887.1 VOC family protein [Sphingomonas metalli]
MDARITPCICYDGAAEEAARFYAATFPDSRVDRVTHAPGDYPAGEKGAVLTVEFTVCGLPMLALNAGPQFAPTDTVSFQIHTQDQAETDRLWDAIVGDGGSEMACSWCKDRWGVAWQIVPRQLTEALRHPDPAAAARAFQAMMGMRRIDIAAIEAAVRGETE